MEIIKLKKLLLRMLSGGCLSNCAITSLWIESELQGGGGRGERREGEEKGEGKGEGKSRKEGEGFMALKILVCTH